MEELTVDEEIEQIKALIAALEEYCTTLQQKVIDLPMQEIDEAQRAGLPLDYVMRYKTCYYIHNVSTAQNIIANIKSDHIPYWQSVIDGLRRNVY